MMETLIKTLVFFNYFFFVIGMGTGIIIFVTAVRRLPKVADQQAMMGEIYTVESIITNMLFGCALVVVNLIAVASAISLGATTSQATDPYDALNYSSLTMPSTDTLKFALLVKSASRALGAYAMCAGLKHGANISHHTEHIRKSARQRLFWGVLTGVAFLFPDFVMNIVANYNSSLESIAAILAQV